jgi:hypothetical protein
MSTTTMSIETRSSRIPAPSRLIGGLGGLAFAATVLVQNVLRSGFPGADATADDVIAHYAGHRTTSLVLAVLFPVGAISLAAFVGALLDRVAHGRSRGAALAGALGAAGILATFTVLAAVDLAVSGYVHRGAPDPDVVNGLWVLHGAVFGVLLASIGVALAGFSAAAVGRGLVPGWWRGLGTAGAGALLVGAAAAPAIVDGSRAVAIGVVGFVAWVGFVVSAAVGLLRRSDA